jgi:putative colanic acid biosynthesis UDP-glucose lipid carrier transferase
MASTNFKDQSLEFRLALDLLMVFIAFSLSMFLTHRIGLQVRKRDILQVGILFITWYQFTTSTEYYRNFGSFNIVEDMFIALKGAALLSLIYAAVAFLVDIGGDERSGFLIFFIITFCLLFLRKYLYRKIYQYFKLNNVIPVVFVGNSSSVKEISESMELRPWMGYSVIGVIDVEDNYDLRVVSQELQGLIETEEIQRIFILESVIQKEDLDILVTTCLSHTVQVFIIPDGLKFYTERYKVQFFDRLPIVAVRSNPLELTKYRLLKRLFDIVFSLMLFLTVLPFVFLVIAIAIKLDSSGPVFFVQDRWGLNNNLFSALKFRSMSANSKDVLQGKYQQAEKNDARITRVGAILRKTNLDELPQFINVLQGSMSIVGPRPHPAPLNEESKDQVDQYLQRHLVKPGITGWAQINGARGETKEISQMQKRVDFDIWYIENWSFYLDVKIIFLTAWKMIKGDSQAY